MYRRQFICLYKWYGGIKIKYYYYSQILQKAYVSDEAKVGMLCREGQVMSARGSSSEPWKGNSQRRKKRLAIMGCTARYFTWRDRCFITREDGWHVLVEDE